MSIPTHPTPGTTQAIWQNTLEGLRAAKHHRSVACWTQTSPVEHSLDTFTVSAEHPFLCQQLAQPPAQQQIAQSLAHAAGRPLRLLCLVRATPKDEDDPLIAEVLRRLNAINKGRVPAQDKTLDAFSQGR